MTGVNRDGSPLIVSSIRLECRRHHVRTSRQADGSAPSRVLKCPPSAERAWGLGGLCAASAEYGAARDERSLAQCEVARPRLINLCVESPASCAGTGPPQTSLRLSG